MCIKHRTEIIRDRIILYRVIFTLWVSYRESLKSCSLVGRSAPRIDKVFKVPRHTETRTNIPECSENKRNLYNA